MSGPLLKKKISPFYTGFALSIILTSFSVQGFCAKPSNTSQLGKVNTSEQTKVNPPPKTKESTSVFQDTRPTLEGKLGYFFFTNPKLRKIYDKGGFDAQISGSYPICKGLQAYASVEYLERNGRSLNNKQKTSVWQVPVNFGLRPVITICKEVQYYVALGPRYFYIHQHNESSYVKKQQGRSGIGMFVNTGFNFMPWNHLLLDVFGEYSYGKIHFHNSKDNVYGERTQVGGFSFGLGMGYVF